MKIDGIKNKKTITPISRQFTGLRDHLLSTLSWQRAGKLAPTFSKQTFCFSFQNGLPAIIHAF